MNVMKHQLIQTENYLLIVDDSEIKIDDLYLNQTGNVIEKLTYRIPSSGHWCKKIIAHLPLNGAPVLEGVDLLPPIEDDVKKLALINAKTPIKEHREQDINTEIWISGARQVGFIEGYNKAKEKYKFTEEDLRKAIVDAWTERGLLTKSEAFLGDYLEHYIQSLQQTKMPVGFECEWNTKQIPEFHQAEPKTTTNSQGQTVWVGKYIFKD